MISVPFLKGSCRLCLSLSSPTICMGHQGRHHHQSILLANPGEGSCRGVDRKDQHRIVHHPRHSHAHSIEHANCKTFQPKQEQIGFKTLYAASRLHCHNIPCSLQTCVLESALSLGMASHTELAVHAPSHNCTHITLLVPQKYIAMPRHYSASHTFTQPTYLSSDLLNSSSFLARPGVWSRIAASRHIVSAGTFIRLSR